AHLLRILREIAFARMTVLARVLGLAGLDVARAARAALLSLAHGNFLSCEKRVTSLPSPSRWGRRKNMRSDVGSGCRTPPLYGLRQMDYSLARPPSGGPKAMTRLATILIALACAVLAPLSSAQDYPVRPV